MKKLLLLLVLSVLTGSCSVMQKISFKDRKFNGVVTYDVKYEGDEFSEDVLSQLPTKSTIYFYKHKVRVDSESPIVLSTTIKDVNANSVMRLLNVKGQKFMILQNSEEINQSLKDREQPRIKHTGRKKSVLGYQCKEVVISTSEGSDTVYYNDKLGNLHYNFDSQLLKDIKGIPLEFSIQLSTSKMKMKAVKVEIKDVDEELFNVDDSYRQITLEELNLLFGE